METTTETDGRSASHNEPGFGFEGPPILQRAMPLQIQKWMQISQNWRELQKNTLHGLTCLITIKGDQNKWVTDVCRQGILEELAYRGGAPVQDRGGTQLRIELTHATSAPPRYKQSLSIELRLELSTASGMRIANGVGKVPPIQLRVTPARQKNNVRTALIQLLCQTMSNEEILAACQPTVSK
jgi:hypothetical protein